jgi:hypothetical protein
MAVTVQRETGNPESLVKTIGAWIEREWDTYRPASQGINAADINFKHAEDRTHNWVAKKGQQLVAFNLGLELRDLERVDSSIKKIGMATQVYIDLWARDLKKAELMAKTINDIILDKRPTQTVNILKSDNVSISKVTKIEESTIDFTPNTIQSAFNQTTCQMSGIITLHWEQSVS